MAKIVEPPEGGYSREWIEDLRTAPRLPAMSVEEFEGRFRDPRRSLGAFSSQQVNALFAAADPPTEDDVGITLEDGTQLSTSTEVEAWFERCRAGTPTP